MRSLPGAPPFAVFEGWDSTDPYCLRIVPLSGLFLRIVTYRAETTIGLHPRESPGFEPGPTFANPGHTVRWKMSASCSIL